MLFLVPGDCQKHWQVCGAHGRKAGPCTTSQCIGLHTQKQRHSHPSCQVIQRPPKSPNFQATGDATWQCPVGHVHVSLESVVRSPEAPRCGGRRLCRAWCLSHEKLKELNETLKRRDGERMQPLPPPPDVASKSQPRPRWGVPPGAQLPVRVSAGSSAGWLRLTTSVAVLTT